MSGWWAKFKRAQSFLFTGSPLHFRIVEWKVLPPLLLGHGYTAEFARYKATPLCLYLLTGAQGRHLRSHGFGH